MIQIPPLVFYVVLMLQWSSNLDWYTPFGARLLLIHCSVILRVLVYQRRIWGSSPHFVGYHSSRILSWISVKELSWEGWLDSTSVCPHFVGYHSSRILLWISVKELSWEGWLDSTSVLLVPHAVCSSFMKSICTVGGAVSLEEKAHCRDTWQLIPPLLASQPSNYILKGTICLFQYEATKIYTHISALLNRYKAY